MDVIEVVFVYSSVAGISAVIVVGSVIEFVVVDIVVGVVSVVVTVVVNAVVVVDGESERFISTATSFQVPKTLFTRGIYCV